MGYKGKVGLKYHQRFVCMSAICYCDLHYSEGHFLMDGSRPSAWKELFFDIFSEGFITVKDGEEIFEQC